MRGGSRSMASVLQEKSKVFALQIIKVCNEIKQSKRESVLTNQLIRSGTSIGANIREAMYAHGKADFIAKLQIALKECSESEYWLELLIESGYYEDKRILEQCVEIKKLLISSINTAKKQLEIMCIYNVGKTQSNFVLLIAVRIFFLFLPFCFCGGCFFVPISYYFRPGCLKSQPESGIITIKWDRVYTLVCSFCYPLGKGAIFYEKLDGKEPGKAAAGHGAMPEHGTLPVSHSRAGSRGGHL